jgi:hypothetical protein
MMQAAKRLINFDAGVIEGDLVYNSIADAIAGHTSKT